MANRLSVMISSTARDLPEHRKQVIAGCERVGCFPLPMENLPADPDDAVRVSLSLVEQAELYVGIFAHRYGYVPDGHDRSVTEMEYDRARARGLPCLIYFMHEDHSLKASDVETGRGAEKLQRFKERLATSHVAGFFKSPDDLRAQILHALTSLKKPETPPLHFVSDIPTPPEVYVAHPYTLLQTRQLIGRQAELNLLTDWVAAAHADVFAAHVLSLVAIGGMGKSALTWKWFHDVAPLEMKPLAGRLWWSFYESDAGFDNFLVRALAYVTRRPRQEVEQLPRAEVEQQLLQALNRQPFLLVLDGLERALVAYARFDAAHLADDDLDQQTGNRVAGPSEIVGPHRLRKTADPRAGAFLKQLAQVRGSRVLVSTRLYPSDLQNTAGQPLAGCHAHFLTGLSDDDALNLWRSLGVSGTREGLLPLFHTFASHPLLVQTLAGAIANYRPAPGDFERWRRDHPHFDPFRLPLTQVKTHVLQHALAGLNGPARKVLESVAGFRMPASYETLAALHVGKACPTADALHLVMDELEGRGLLGWDRRANRYDLHPIVRGVTWSSLSGDARRGIYDTLSTHFEALPAPSNSEVKRLEDLAPAVELFNSLVGLQRFNEGLSVFNDRLDAPLLLILVATRERNELLAMLFPEGIENDPPLEHPFDRAYVLSSLALGQDLIGLPERALVLHGRALALLNKSDDGAGRDWLDSRPRDLDVALYLCAHSLFAVGRLREAEGCLRMLWKYLRSMEMSDFFPALAALWGKRNLHDLVKEAVTFLDAYIPVTKSLARLIANERLTMSMPQRYRQHDNVLRTSLVRPFHYWGYDEERLTALTDCYFSGQLRGHEDTLAHGLRLARDLGLVEEELAFLIALAELKHRGGDVTGTRALLADLWEPAENGPYPLLHADGRNLLAALERDAGDHKAAAAAALHAYRLAWCDGPPFAYVDALETARTHLKALGVAEPHLPPYDEARFEPMPEVAFGTKTEGDSIFD